MASSSVDPGALLPEEPAELEPASGADDASAARPYSLRNEVRFFFGQGVPLCLSAVLEWGAPPLITMFFAGATPESAHLQSALGYGRVFFNVSMLMVLLGMNSYIWNVLPGCIGAARKDRIPHYFRRGVVLATLGSLPCFALQFASEPIMLAVGVEPSVAADVGTYTRIMAGGAWLLLLECHVEVLFIASGYARSASFNSLLTGLGVDVLCNYFFVYRWRWGVCGAALAWSAVRASRLLVWAGLAAWFRLFHPFFLPRTREPLLCRKEVREFVRLAAPSIASNFSGWLIFELQIIALTNVHGVSTAQVAAGAIWVQCEQALSAAQSGWIQVIAMRTLALLGKCAPGAPHAFAVHILLASLLVAAYNVALYLASAAVTRLVSDDAAVRAAFGGMVWLLIPHTQSRILSIAATCLFVPLGKPLLSIAATFVCFYAVASPIVAVLALTDLATTDAPIKMALCMGATCIAQVPLALFGLSYCSRLDWRRAGRVINARANTDKRGSMSPPHAPEGGSAPSIAPASPCAAAARGGASPLAITPLVLTAPDQPSCTRVN